MSDKYRIMIVDDDEDACRVLALVLRDSYEVVEAHDGLDALSKLEVYEPDLAIIDIMMPLMDGFQVCESIRRHPRFNNMQVMFLSAYGSKENIRHSYAVGANLFMTKPVDPGRVLKNIDFTIEHEPPPLRVKKYTIEQLKRMEEEEALRIRMEVQHQEELKRRPPPEPVPPPQPEPKVESKPEPAAARGHAEKARPAREATIKAAPDAECPAAPAAEGDEEAVGLPARLLIVDDDEEMQHMLDLAMREQYEVTSVLNGLEAIERIVDFEPDLMLLDIMMPKMNGYQVLQSIRRNRYLKSLPVIVISAKTSPKDREYAARLGATNFIAKPYKVDDLLKTLDTLVKTPGFKIKAKKMTIEQIRALTVTIEKEREDRMRHASKATQYAKLREVIREGLAEDEKASKKSRR